MALLRAGLLVVLFVVAVGAREGCEAEDEALLQVTQVDTMAGSQVTPKTWTSPRDLAYVPPPQTGKLSRFLNISIYSAAPAIAVKRREGPGKLHLLSHRSCSQDQSAECNQGFIKEMEGVSKKADTAPEINERHLYTSLPDELMNDPRWQNHVKPGVRGRGYWFWKAALSRMLLSQGVFQLGDELLYVDGDSKTMIKHIIRMRSRNPEDLIIGAQKFCEHVWTKGDIFQRFGTTWDSPHYGLTQQPHARAFLMRLNERTLKLLQIWEGLMTDFHLVSDAASRNKTLDGRWLNETRHDQSILSMILKASISKPGSCNEHLHGCYQPGCDLLGSKNATAGWQVHPELGVRGLTVKFFPESKRANKRTQRNYP